jgi:hypothetical protein
MASDWPGAESSRRNAMYAQTSGNVLQTPTHTATATPSRAVLKTRPRIQRICIRSWEYIPPVRATVVAVRMLAVLWLFFLAAMLVSNGIAWGWTLPPAAVGVFALSLWVFRTAAKGWPVADA